MAISNMEDETKIRNSGILSNTQRAECAVFPIKVDLKETDDPL